jgi:hypothetical protein
VPPGALVSAAATVLDRADPSRKAAAAVTSLGKWLTALAVMQNEGFERAIKGAWRQVRHDCRCNELRLLNWCQFVLMVVFTSNMRAF